MNSSALRIFWLCFGAFVFVPVALGQSGRAESCPRPSPGGMAQEPEDLRSKDGVLRVDLAFRSESTASSSVRYCYMSAGGAQSPNLRVHRGDLLILRLDRKS